MGELKLVIDAKATLGEGPFWHPQKCVLYWVDIMEKKVHIHNPATNTNKSIDVGQYVGAVVPREDGGCILAMHNGFYALNEESEEITPLTDPESDIPTNRFNDGKCDPAGRFWAGTMSLNNGGPVGALYCLDTDLNVQKKVDHVTCSNGLAWSSDHKTMYYIDTPTKQVVAFDYQVQNGEIDNKRVVVTIPEGEGAPDGMTIDREGMLWVAHWGGYQVSRWNPQNGEKLSSIPVPAAQVTSCAFGGEQLDELYITTARIGLSEEALQEQPHAGGVFCYKTAVKGQPTNSFAG